MPKWLKDSIFYEVYPSSFYDSNGDGIGDINGIAEKLEYIKELGCNAIWINACFESAFMDGGYDVTDYRKVAARYGTNRDMKNLFDKAHRLDMKILLDLVPGHTSDQHEWFLESKKAERNEYSDRYIWTDGVWQAPDEYRFVYGTTPRDANYMINFFSTQPALNYGFYEVRYPWQMHYTDEACLETRDEMIEIMRFWLKMGCDGFRVDMADSLVKNDPDKIATAQLWEYVHNKIRSEFPECATVAEWCHPNRAINKADFDMDFYLDHYGNGYNSLFRYVDKETGYDRSFFSKNGKGDITAFLDEYENNLKITTDKGYISLITCNHDTPRMTYNLDERAIRLAYTFIFTMPGIPFLYYGDEIGMAYQAELPNKEGGYQRTGTRTPMQWNDGKNLGFSEADEIYLPVEEGENAPTVEAQEQDENSLLNFMKSLLKLRKDNPELGSDGEFEVLYAKRKEFPFVYKRGSFTIAVNPSEKPVAFPVKMEGKEVFSIGKSGLRMLGDQSLVIYKS